MGTNFADLSKICAFRWVKEVGAALGQVDQARRRLNCKINRNFSKILFYWTTLVYIYVFVFVLPKQVLPAGSLKGGVYIVSFWYLLGCCFEIAACMCVCTPIYIYWAIGL